MAEQLVFDRLTPEADSYHGPAEVAVAPFRGPPEQIMPAVLMGQLVAQLGATLRGNGRPLLRMRAWADTSPAFWTLYRIELTLADPGRAPSVQLGETLRGNGRAGMSSPFPILIVGAVLLGLGLVALAAWQVSNIEWGPLGLGLPLALGAALVLLLLLSGKR